VEFSGRYILGNDNVIASYMTIAVVFLMFIVLLIMYKTDKSTAPVYNYNKNVMAGAMCLFAASALVVDVGCYLPSILFYGVFSWSIILNIVFSCLAAVGLFMLSWSHISARKPPAKVSLYMVTIPVWCVIKLLTSLIHNSSTSVAMTDVLDLFIYMFLTLFLFSSISVISVVNNGNSVKGVMLFGLPLVATLVTYDISIGVNLVINGYSVGYYTEIIRAIELTLFAAYAFSFMREVTKYSPTKDEVKIIDNDEDMEELVEKKRQESLENYEKIIEEERKEGNYYIIQETEYSAYETPGTYASASSYIAGVDSNEDGTLIEDGQLGENREDSSVYDEVNHIDRLILEITSGENDLDLEE
ncbi:MAG: hypothetical protein ACI4RL_00005, partial [Ruminococcus sp.]